MLKAIIKFFKLLNSNVSINAIAFGLSLGFLLAQYPIMNIQWFIMIILIFFVFKVNWAAFSIFLIIFKLIPPILDSVAHKVGIYILSMEHYQRLFEKMYNNPIWFMTKFYNSIVMGYSLLFVPILIVLFFIFKLLIKIYREKWKKSIVSAKWYKAFIKLPIITKIIKLGKSINIR